MEFQFRDLQFTLISNVSRQKDSSNMNEKWILAEAKHKLTRDSDNDSEVDDLGIANLKLTLDVSIAHGVDPETKLEGLSIILTPPSTLAYAEEDGGEQWMISQLIPFTEEHPTPADLIELIAHHFCIKPDARIWEDAAYLHDDEEKD
jgi:hypothetical protein